MVKKGGDSINMVEENNNNNLVVNTILVLLKEVQFSEKFELIKGLVYGPFYCYERLGTKPKFTYWHIV